MARWLLWLFSTASLAEELEERGSWKVVDRTEWEYREYPD
jgi:hypothetical protein